MNAQQVLALISQARAHGINTLIQLESLIAFGTGSVDTPTKLHQAHHFTAATSTNTIDSLEDLGFATRRKDRHDRRVLRIELTAQGSAAYQSLLNPPPTA